MVRYFYGWTPLVVVAGTFVLVTVPYLALIALMIVSLVAPAALALATVSITRLLGRTIGRRLQIRSGTGPRRATALSQAGRRTRSAPAGAAVLLARTSSQREHVS
jgi:hypothetical protein